MEISFGMISGVFRFLTGLWEYVQKRPNIRIEIDYSRRQEISDKSVAVMDLPRIKTVVDPKVVVITLTNIGHLPAVISELGVVIKEQKIILTRVPPGPVASNYVGGVTIRSSIQIANLYQFASSTELEQIDFHKQFKAEVWAALFDFGVDDVYVKDTIGNEWSIEPKLLKRFYVEYDKDNPILNPHRKRI